jgi:hypothetical protein
MIRLRLRLCISMLPLRLRTRMSGRPFVPFRSSSTCAVDTYRGYDVDPSLSQCSRIRGLGPSRRSGGKYVASQPGKIMLRVGTIPSRS